MKYSIACCLLTHNHPEILKEILDRCLRVYSDHGIDICIYDDSEDDFTKNIIEQYISEGASNLYYIDIHNAVNGDHKYYLLMQGYGLPREYDYIWPCKDRVCFEGRYLDALCAAIDEGHDVVIGYNENSRWDVGVKLSREVYSEPAEFYRLYAMASTNWEALIRRRDTMLKPIDWKKYEEQFHIGAGCNFNQTITMFARLSEMDTCSLKVCRYAYEDRYISPNDHSSWVNKTFELWIDRWVKANFSLPSCYDKYKAEVIKSQTNLAELFGSVERFILLKEEGLFNREVFEKYQEIWKYVTEIPVSYLQLILEGDYTGAIKNTIDEFELCLKNHDFRRAWWVVTSNSWFKNVYDERTYTILVTYFNKFRNDMMQYGMSHVFNGVDSIDDLKSL